MVNAEICKYSVQNDNKVTFLGVLFVLVRPNSKINVFVSSRPNLLYIPVDEKKLNRPVSIRSQHG